MKIQMHVLEFSSVSAIRYGTRSEIRNIVENHSKLAGRIRSDKVRKFECFKTVF